MNNDNRGGGIHVGGNINGGNVSAGDMNITINNNSATQSKNMENKKTILIVAANPTDTAHLRLGTEVRDIEKGLRLTANRDHFELKQQHATRIQDLRRAMQTYTPAIAHFCGHGYSGQGIALENTAGTSQLIAAKPLANFFKFFKNTLECVLLNACCSEPQAQAIVEHIPYAIGMSDEIGDDAAIEFAVAFYDTLGSGGDYETAYEVGCNALEMEGIEDYLIPRLFKKNNDSEKK